MPQRSEQARVHFPAGLGHTTNEALVTAWSAKAEASGDYFETKAPTNPATEAINVPNR